MASIAIIICILLATLLLVPKANELMRFSIYSSVLRYPSYYLVLYDDATLKCFFGEKGTDDIQADKFMHKIRKCAKTKLNEIEFSWLIGLADELVESGYAGSDWECDDWYYMTLLYNGTAYREVYQHSQSEIIQELSEHFLRLAPMKIELGWQY